MTNSIRTSTPFGR